MRLEQGELRLPTLLSAGHVTVYREILPHSPSSYALFLLSSLQTKQPQRAMLRPRSSTLILKRSFHTTLQSRGILGLRKEDPARIFERRAPLSPRAVESLIQQGHQVLVEKSSKRIYSDQSYQTVGAELIDTLDSKRCHVVAGVKEPLCTNLPLGATKTTHLGFFHCHKGQSYNLPLLEKLIESQSRIIDYELLTTTREGKRTTGFGKLAGFSGMSDGLSQLGTKLLASKGVATPFLKLRRPIQAGTVDKVEKDLRKCAKEIKENGIDKDAGPVRWFPLSQPSIETLSIC